MLEPNELYLSGATIDLYSGTSVANRVFVASTITNAQGQYLFNGLSPGAYQLVETPPTGYANSGVQTNLSEVNQPVVAIDPQTIQVTVVDPTSLTASVNGSAFLSNGNNWIGVRFNYTGGSQATAVGEFQASLSTPSLPDYTGLFPTLCVEVGLPGLNNGPNSYGVLPGALPTAQYASAANAGEIGYLYNTYALSPSLSRDDAAGLQLAIWQLEYGSNVSSFAFLSTSGSTATQADFNAAVAKENFYLGDSAGKSETVDFLNATGQLTTNSYQSILATGSLNFANIPAPSLVTIPSQTNVTLGTGPVTLKDTAMLSGGNAPTGTITFTLYQGSTLVDTETATVSGNGPYATPTGYTLPTVGTVAGTYQWNAVYSSGDSNNASVSDIDNPNEQVIVNQASSSVSTAIYDSSGGAVTDELGEQVYDTATVIGSSSAPTPTGTVTYEFFSTSDGTGPHADETVTLDANGMVPDSSITAALMAGSYSYIGVYSGDGNYMGYTGAVEPLTINQASSSVSTAIFDYGGAAGMPGEQVYDTATVTGAPFTPSGSVTYYFYDTATPTYGITTPATMQTVTLNADGTVPASDPTAGLLPGGYAYIAVYSGDTNYSGDIGAIEPLTISQASSGANMSTTLYNAAPPRTQTIYPTPPQPLGTSVFDTATGIGSVGGPDPTGNVNFYFSTDGGATYTLFDTEPVGAPTKDTGPLPAGSYAFEAQYLGDSYYQPSPLTASENFAISTATPSVDTTIVMANADWSTSPLAQPAALGTSVEDTASFDSLVPGFAPTGTVTYTFTGSELGLSAPAGWTVVNSSTWTDTVTVSGGTIPNSAATGPLAAGTDYNFSATYTPAAGETDYLTSTSDAEPLSISKATSSVSTAIFDSSGGAVTSALGEQVYDTATVTGTPFTPSGTLTYEFFSTSNGTGPHVDQIVTLNANGTVPNSSISAALMAGSYSYIGVYSGDSNYSGYTGAVEPLSIGKGSSSVSTVIKDSGGGAVTDVLGEKVYDTATVTGTPFTPTGTLTYEFFTTLNGTGSHVDQVVTLNANGTVPNSSISAALMAGSYSYIGVYSGDSNYSGYTGAVEPLSIGKGSSSVSTVIKDSGGGAVTDVLGEKVYDTATVTGTPFTPTGTLTYEFFTTLSGTGSHVDQVVTLNANGTVPNSSISAALMAGSYSYIGVYSGDGNYAGFTGAVEPLTINKGSSSVSTAIYDSTGCGPTSGISEKVYDTATVTGTPFTPTGTLTYYFYTTATPVFPTTTPSTTQTVHLNSNGSVPNSATTAVLMAGSYAYIGVYSGDSNYNGFTGAVEPLTIGKASPSLSTTPGGSVVLGGGTKLTDSAMLSGATSPTGTITFTLYSPSSTAVYTDVVTVTNNGSYSTSTGNNPGGFLPTAATGLGTYQWVVTYSGDTNNKSVTSPSGSEPETVTSTIIISGTKYLDCTGNGFSSDDTTLGGVTIHLYLSSNGSSGLQTGAGGDTLVATTTTASNGTYSFTNLMPGTYYVQEVVPAGYIQTGGGPNGSAGATYYTVTTACCQSYGGNNFDDFQIPTCAPTNVSFKVNNNNCYTTVGDLRGNTQQGDSVTVTFTVTPGMNDQLSLVSYTAPGSSFDSTTAYKQQIFDVATGVFGPGTHTLTVLIPNCFYQIDFICGQAIDVLGPTNYGPDSSNIFYSAESRLLSADNGGTVACTTKSITTGGFGTAGYWCTTTGQNVIKCLNGSSSSTCLAQWLATCYPNLYGSGTGSHCLINSNGTYFTNSQVASAYSKFTGGDEQVLSAALSTYCTSVNLAGLNVHNTDTHFTTSLAGSGMYTYNVGVNGATFGLANSSTCTVMQLLMNVNHMTNAGSSVTSGANAVFSGINTAGNVTNADLSSSGLAYSPADVRTAYGINHLSLDGSGQTIAIVDAFDNPAIFQALDIYDSQFGTTTAGPTLYQQYGAASSFLTVMNQSGQTDSLPATDPTGGWEAEEALDVEWIHAVAPGAQIVLVEANSDSLSDLMSSVGTAAQQPGVSVVSMSWGFAEGQSVLAADEAYYDQFMTTPAGHQGVTFVASTGDYGTADPEYPAYSPNVVAVGGTSLYLNSDSSYNSETGWGYNSDSVGEFIGGGGGVSQFEAEPAFQLGVQASGNRTTPDVSFVADPATGVWIADPYNLSAGNSWEVAGGTSLSAPSWAALIALADQGRAAAGEAGLGSAGTSSAQQALYNVSSSDFTDVTSGTNGDFTAGAGYDLVTGLGSPVANRLVADLVSYAGAINAPTTPATFLAGYVPSGTSDAAVSAGPANFNVFSIMTSQGFSAGPRSSGATATNSFVGTIQTGFASPVGTVLGASSVTSGVNRVSEVAFTPSLSNVGIFDGGQRSWGADGTMQSVYVSAGDDSIVDRSAATPLRASDVDLLMSDWNRQDRLAPAADSNARAADNDDVWSGASWLDDVDVNDLVAAAERYTE